MTITPATKPATTPATRLLEHPLPFVTLDDAALRHNIRVMAEFAARHGAVLAPHIKTHLSAELTRRQLEAGAWGVTVATAEQARWAHTFGARRILVANEVLDPAGLRLLETLSRSGTWTACVVDSVAAVTLMDAVLTSELPVLVELGYPGGRTGARGVDAAEQVAMAITASAHLRLVGVEGYEGAVAGAEPARQLERVDDFLAQLAELARRLDARGLFTEDRIIRTAGGSAYFDRVTAALATTSLSRPSVLVLRAGAYVTHDHLAYTRSSPLGGRVTDEPALRPAATLWARVLSRPEPGLAVAGAGKRECPYDLDLPIVLRAWTSEGSPRPVDGIRVTALNDHHMYLAVPDDGPLAPGDVVVLGLSHPCTIFDKWDALPVLDEQADVVEVVRPVVRRTHPDEPDWAG